MTVIMLLLSGWATAKSRLFAVLVAALLYGGIHQVLGVLRYVLMQAALSGINAVIRERFPNSFPLFNPYEGVPWQYDAKTAAIGMLVLAWGLFLGYWVRERNQPKPSA